MSEILFGIAVAIAIIAVGVLVSMIYVNRGMK